MCLFKFGNPNNSRFIYIFSLFIVIRKTILLILKKFCLFEGTLITAWLMFGGELLIGLCNIIVEYKKLLNINIDKFLGIPIISNKKEPLHRKSIKVLLFLFCAILDLLFYFFVNYYVTKRYKDILLLDIRLSSSQLIFTSIFCFLILFQAIKVVKIISLFFIIVSLIGIILVDCYLRKNLINNEDIKLLIFIIGSYLFLAVQYFIEKVLMEYDNSTPFQILFYEGIFGNIIMLILSLFKMENKFPDKEKIDNFWILIVGFILYFLSSCFLNIYKLSVIYSSSATNAATCDSFALPFILILYFFINKNEFNAIDKKGLYIGINFIAIIVIIFCCVLFNEIIIFSCQDDIINKKDNKNNKIKASFISSNQNELDGSFTTEGEDSF